MGAWRFRIRWSLLLLTLFPAVAVGQNTAIVQCPDPDSGTEELVPVTIASIEAGLVQQERAAKGWGIHILDLPEEVRLRRRRLPVDVGAQRWCVVKSHVRAFDDAMAIVAVDNDFVSEKFRRVVAWLDHERQSSSPLGSAAMAAEYIDKASTFLNDSDYVSANEKLNRGIDALFGLSGLWSLPTAGSIAETARDDEERKITRFDIQRACSQLPEVHTAELLNRKLAAVMTGLKRRKLRPVDIAMGEELFSELHRYRRMGAWWSGTRIACVLVDRTEEIEIDLGSVIKRFRLVEQLTRDGLPVDERRSEFKKLMELSAQSVSRRDYTTAHEQLDQLLVLLGRPQDAAMLLENN